MWQAAPVLQNLLQAVLQVLKGRRVIVQEELLQEQMADNLRRKK